MVDIGSYIAAVVWNWWTLVAGIMIGIEPVSQFLWGGYDDFAAKWLTAPRRRGLSRIGATLAFVIANYLAFHDVKDQLRTAEGQIRASPTVDNTFPFTLDQKLRLGSELDRVPSQNRFKITILCNDNAAVYANRIVSVFASHGWKASAACSFIIVSTSQGFGFAFAPGGSNKISANASILMKLFDQAEIPYSKVEMGLNLNSDDCYLAVGLPE